MTIAERKGRNARPVLSGYTFDYEAVKAGGYNIKIFESYYIEWLEYVVDCRKGDEMQNKYDIVEGGVANDNVIDTVEDYESGIITAEQALGQLKYKQVNHQICILSQDIVEKHLSFVSAENLKMEDGQ